MNRRAELLLAAWEHELRDRRGRWVKDVGGPQWFSPAGQAAGKQRPDVGDKMLGELSGGQPVVGTVVARVGLVAAIDADDGHRYEINWANGSVIVRKPLAIATPARVLRGEEQANQRQIARMEAERKAGEARIQALVKQRLTDRQQTAEQQERARLAALPPAEYGESSEPVRELRKLFAGDVLDNADAKPGDQPTEGKQGETEILTLPDGSKIVYKQQVPERNDREELSYYVSQAITASGVARPDLPPIARDPANPWVQIQRMQPGQIGARYLADKIRATGGDEGDIGWYDYEDEIEQELADTPAGHDIGKLDLVVSNSDRNLGNYLVDENEIVHPIDMGMAQFDGEEYGSSFLSGATRLAPGDVARLEAELRKLEPEFRRLGHEDWFVVMMDHVHKLAPDVSAIPMMANELGYGWAVIELTRSAAWLHELRDADGQWTRTPGSKPGTGLHRYTVPPHERLINHRADVEDPADYPFFKKHPVSAQNIIDAYDATDPDTRDAGMHWYSDAHLLSAALAGGDAEEGAILLGNYSSSANWPVNMFRAARVAHEGKPIPKGQGYISGDQVKKAWKALHGDHIDDVLISPKTRSFAHLLARGDDAPDDPYGHVVIDAHALNVAAGGTIRGATYARGKKQQELPPEDKSPLDDARAYEYVGDQYRQAAAFIRQRDGIEISPHQMQAVTWVGQVLANQAEDKAAMEALEGGAMGRAKGRLANLAKDWRTWLDYAKKQHLPLIAGVSALAAQALEADLELAGDDSMFAQLIGLVYELPEPPPFPEGSLAAQALNLAGWEHELRAPDGRWVKAGDEATQLVRREREYQQALAQRQAARTYPVLGPEDARGNSRPVSHDEFQQLARQGNRWIDQAKNHSAPISGLDDHWDQVKARAYAEARKSWGGATIDTDTGQPLPQGADLYALSVKPRGMTTVSVPEHISEAEFGATMDRAKELFRPALERRGFYLGVFHDDDLGRIDIDPVAIVDSVDLVEKVGAYTHAKGGAYHFKSGDGFWPPHVAEGAGMANDDDGTHFEHGYAQWHTQAVAVQDPEPDDAD